MSTVSETGVQEYFLDRSTGVLFGQDYKSTFGQEYKSTEVYSKVIKIT